MAVSLVYIILVAALIAAMLVGWLGVRWLERAWPGEANAGRRTALVGGIVGGFFGCLLLINAANWLAQKLLDAADWPPGRAALTTAEQVLPVDPTVVTNDVLATDQALSLGFWSVLFLGSAAIVPLLVVFGRRARSEDVRSDRSGFQAGVLSAWLAAMLLTSVAAVWG